MKPWLHKIEVLVDKSIPYLVILLLFLIVTEFSFPEKIAPYLIFFEIADTFIIVVFVADLAFKYNRLRDVKKFFKRYWLDVIAIFPFYLLFRAFEQVFAAFRVSEFTAGQQILHESLALEKEAPSIVKGIEKESAIIAKETKLARLSRFIKPIQRLPRLLRAKVFFVKKHGKPVSHEEEKKAKKKK